MNLCAFCGTRPATEQVLVGLFSNENKAICASCYYDRLVWLDMDLKQHCSRLRAEMRAGGQVVDDEIEEGAQP